MIYAYYSKYKKRLAPGKTSCLNGLALRLLAHQIPFKYVRFWKKSAPSEDQILHKLGVNVKCYQTIGHFIWTADEQTRQKMVAENLAGAMEVLQTRDSVKAWILDEAIDLFTNQVFDEKAFCDWLLKISENNRIVCISGHTMTKKILKICDVVTEMRKHKHHFDQGVKAVKGIEY